MHKKTSTSMLTLLALGVVFGDIGTSPIYAFQQSISDGQSNLNGIYGTVSLIFWALTIVVSIKYLIFVLRAENKGEGGVLALFSLLPKGIRNPSSKRRYLVFFAMLLGTAFLFGDGMITPAISVLSAIEGTAEINPHWVHLEVPITVIILGVLFIFQSKGTTKLGKLFGPITLLWFISIGFFGVKEITKYPSILKSLSPSYAISYIGQNGFNTFIILSSVILAITGVEALYADMGHFGAKPIRIAWFLIVGPALIANYLGQAALEIINPKASSALFFNMASTKSGVIYLVIISTLATIIASQALISGVGSISRQAVQLGLFPRLKIIHTSDTHEGQIYVPVINTMLGIGTIFLVVVFGTSAKLANAYSFAIAGTMLITTLALYIVMVKIWKWNRIISTSLISFFVLIDLGFFLSTSTKILKGAWLPLGIAILIVYGMWAWFKGQKVLQEKLNSNSITWNDVEILINQGKVVNIPTYGIYMSSNIANVPQAISAQINNLHVLPTQIIVVSVETVDAPFVEHVPLINKLNDHVTTVHFEVGYLDNINVPAILRQNLLTSGEEEKATYYLADRKITGANSGELKGFQRKVFSFLHRNASQVASYYGLPEDRIISLAVHLDL